MSPIERLAIAAVVLAAGAAIGWVIRHRRQLSSNTWHQGQGLPAGLVLVMAPYCTRCASLRSRLTAAGIEFNTIDAGAHPTLVRSVDITTAPTLLRVTTSGHITDRESQDFSEPRLSALAMPPS